MKSLFFYNTLAGKIGVAENGIGITDIFFEHELDKEDYEDYIINETELLKQAGFQLNEYFAGRLKVFDLPLSFEGTDFQKSVWKALIEIPYAQTLTYGEVAAKLGNPKASRAVGMANNKNPIMIVVPCHRVIGAKGRLVGYAGGIDIKEKLLKLENCNIT